MTGRESVWWKLNQVGLNWTKLVLAKNKQVKKKNLKKKRKENVTTKKNLICYWCNLSNEENLTFSFWCACPIFSSFYFFVINTINMASRFFVAFFSFFSFCVGFCGRNSWFVKKKKKIEGFSHQFNRMAARLSKQSMKTRQTFAGWICYVNIKYVFFIHKICICYNLQHLRYN